MGIDSYSITPATNATADAGAINWAEGQPPSTVNNTARQMLADTRTAFNDLVWFQYGTGDQGAGNIAVPTVYASATSFTISGANVTSVYTVGRRVRAVGATTGTIYGTISVTAYSAPTTTVTVVWDSGSLSNETLVVSLSQLPITGKPIYQPAIRRNRYVSMAGFTPSGTSSTTGVMMGLGSSFALTPLNGTVKITITGWAAVNVSGASLDIGLRYGTGTAPVNGAAVTGTSAFTSQDIVLTAAAAGSPAIPYTIFAEVSGLTANTAYWFDIVCTILGGLGGTSTLRVSSVLIEEV